MFLGCRGGGAIHLIVTTDLNFTFSSGINANGVAFDRNFNGLWHNLCGGGAGGSVSTLFT